MKSETMSAEELLRQLLTLDFGGSGHKHTCLLRLLKEEALRQRAIQLLEGS